MSNRDLMNSSCLHWDNQPVRDVGKAWLLNPFLEFFCISKANGFHTAFDLSVVLTGIDSLLG